MTDLITNRIQFPSDGHTTPGYLAKPTYAGPHRGVVVVQEWWGVVPHIEEVARRLARNGFVTLAPDLYYGEATEEPDEARKLAMTLDSARAVTEIVAAAKYLKSLDQVQPKWVGIIGFCMGGGLAMSAAAHSGDFAAAISFYGNPLDEKDIPRLQAPLLGIYGENDLSIPPEEVRAFDEKLDTYHLPHEIVTYPDAGHAFFNDARPDHYHEESARDAWNRTLAWLRLYLG